MGLRRGPDCDLFLPPPVAHPRDGPRPASAAIYTHLHLGVLRLRGALLTGKLEPFVLPPRHRHRLIVPRHWVQLTTDGHWAYLEAVESAFGADIDYAMLLKLYGTPPEAE